MLQTSPDTIPVSPGGDALDQPVYVHDLLVYSLRTHLRDLGEDLDQTRRVMALVKVAMAAALALMLVDGLASSPGVRRATSAYADILATYVERVASHVDGAVASVEGVVPKTQDTIARMVAAVTPAKVQRPGVRRPRGHAREEAAKAAANPSPAPYVGAADVKTPPAVDAPRTVDSQTVDSRAVDGRTGDASVPAVANTTLPDLFSQGAPAPVLAPPKEVASPVVAAQVAKLEPVPASTGAKPEAVPNAAAAPDDKLKTAALAPSPDRQDFAEAFKSATRMLERRLTPEERAEPIDPQYLDAVLRIEGIYDPTRIGPFGSALRMAVRPGTMSMSNVFGDRWTRAVPDPNVHYRTQYYAQTWMRPKSTTCDDFWRFRPDNFLVRLDKLAPEDCQDVHLALNREPDPVREEHVVPAVVSVPAFAAPYPGGRMSPQEMRAALQARIQAAEERLWFKRPAAPPQ